MAPRIQLEHWHTGSMAWHGAPRCWMRWEPDPVALIHPLDLAALGAQPGDSVTIQSRRGR